MRMMLPVNIEFYNTVLNKSSITTKVIRAQNTSNGLSISVRHFILDFDFSRFDECPKDEYGDTLPITVNAEADIIYRIDKISFNREIDCITEDDIVLWNVHYTQEGSKDKNNPEILRVIENFLQTQLATDTTCRIELEN